MNERETHSFFFKFLLDLESLVGNEDLETRFKSYRETFKGKYVKEPNKQNRSLLKAFGNASILAEEVRSNKPKINIAEALLAETFALHHDKIQSQQNEKLQELSHLQLRLIQDKVTEELTQVRIKLIEDQLVNLLKERFLNSLDYADAFLHDINYKRFDNAPTTAANILIVIRLNYYKNHLLEVLNQLAAQEFKGFKEPQAILRHQIIYYGKFISDPNWQLHVMPFTVWRGKRQLFSKKASDVYVKELLNIFFEYWYQFTSDPFPLSNFNPAESLENQKLPASSHPLINLFKYQDDGIKLVEFLMQNNFVSRSSLEWIGKKNGFLGMRDFLFNENAKRRNLMLQKEYTKKDLGQAIAQSFDKRIGDTLARGNYLNAAAKNLANFLDSSGPDFSSKY